MIGSRNGFWDKLLEILGGIVISTDTEINLGEEPLRYHDGIMAFGAVQAVKTFLPKVLFMFWMKKGTYAHDALLEFKGDTLIFVGEGRGGIVANDAFFNLLKEEWVLEKNIELQKWLNIRDGLSIYKRAILDVKILDEDETSDDETCEEEY